MIEQALIRFGTPDDVPFIYNSWLKSHRDVFRSENMDGSAFSAKDIEMRRQMKERHDQTKFMKNVSYFSSYKKHVTNLLSRAQVLLAVDSEKPDLIYAYLVFERVGKSATVVHYAYTKHVYRKLGLIKRLVLESGLGSMPSPIFLTVHNLAVSEIRAKYPELLVYDPYILE